MSIQALKSAFSIAIISLLILFSSMALAQEPPSAAVEQGANAWNNWTEVDSGGNGTLPGGISDKDYIRCKSCHGWDREGTDGGYARRSRKATRPNAGAGDGDATSRVIPEVVTREMLLHEGTGRTFAEGEGSWVALDDTHSSQNKAAYANGYTLGNQHPDFSGGELTSEQVDNLVAFLNFEDGKPSVYFSKIDPTQNPVLYTIVDTADATAGETFYNATCFGCHGDPATDFQGANGGEPEGGILAYLESDGKYSELAHAARWGMPGEIMSRAALGSPTSANITDMLLYLQDLGGTGFAVNPGLSGHWWNREQRSGEGLLVDASLNAEGKVIVIISFYTYDSMGNQVWLIGAGPAVGNQVVVEEFEITDGAMWGADFDPVDVTRTVWGKGTFTFSSCDAGQISLEPNMDMQGNGFTDLAYEIGRDLLIPGISCPTPSS